MTWWKKRVSLVLAIQLGVVGVAYAASDPSFSSTNYKVIENDVGTNGDLRGSSANYQFGVNLDDGGSTLGDTAVGNSSSTNYQTNSGFNTTAQPGLTLIVNTGLVDFGTVSVGTKTQATATFSVKNYTSYGYVAKIVGTAPRMGAHVLTSLGSDTAYNATQEQFGLNLRLNSAPAMGADPAQTPSSAFSFGEAGDGATGVYGVSRPYTIPNQYRFVSGETVAYGPKSSGETDYTMTLMMNAVSGTPGGMYTGGLSIVVTGTY